MSVHAFPMFAVFAVFAVFAAFTVYAVYAVYAVLTGPAAGRAPPREHALDVRDAPPHPVRSALRVPRPWPAVV